MIAFAIENKDNFESWGKYELDELQDAYAEMPEADRASAAGQRIKQRMDELESGKDRVEELRQEEAAEYQGEDIEVEETTAEPAPEPAAKQAETPKNNTPLIVGGILIVVIILLLVLSLI